MFSPLTEAIIYSPNYNYRKNATFNPTGKIIKITPHHSASVSTGAQIARTFTSPSRQASANYCIGNAGDIVGCVDEANRAWTSGSAENDFLSVTIECSNSETGEPWKISDQAWASLVKLCTDICKRNGIPELIFTGDAEGNLTAHRMFQATACPGTYLYNRFPELAAEVNKNLKQEEGEDEPMTADEKKAFDKLQKEFNALKKDYDKHTRVKYGYVDKNMPEWAREPISDLIKKGYLQGDENGNLQLSADALRELVILDRTLNG